MNKDDRDEIREMLQDVLIGHTNEMIGRLNVMGATLLRVDMQVTKTNGRVTDIEHDIEKLKLQNAQHVLNCPLSDEIKDLENNVASRIKDLEVNSSNRIKDLEDNSKKEINGLEAEFSERIKPIEINEISRKAISRFFILLWTIVGGTVAALILKILTYFFPDK